MAAAAASAKCAARNPLFQQWRPHVNERFTTKVLAGNPLACIDPAMGTRDPYVVLPGEITS